MEEKDKVELDAAETKRLLETSHEDLAEAAKKKLNAEIDAILRPELTAEELLEGD